MHAAQSELDSRKCFHFDGFAIERETLVLPLRQGFCSSFYPDGPPTLQVNFFYFAILPNHDPEITSPSIRVASAFGGYSGSTFASKCSRETVSITCNLDTPDGRGPSSYFFGDCFNWTTAARTSGRQGQLDGEVAARKAERTRTPRNVPRST